MELIEQAKEKKPLLVKVRREFHRHPEPAFQETQTIERELERSGIAHTRVSKTGVRDRVAGVMIYLDYSANTPADPAVLEVFCRTEQRFPGNPNSTHPAGRAAREELARVTDSIAGMLDGTMDVIYTSGASESNNLAVKGAAQRHPGGHIIASVLEHPSIIGALQMLERQGWRVDWLEVHPDGTVQLEQLRKLLRPDTCFVSVCAVDSELGTVQPIPEIADIICQCPDCVFHVDATQAVGKTVLTFRNVDLMSLSPHKFYGLNGSGLLLKRRRVRLEPQISGGEPSVLRGGTPTLALAAAAEKALATAFTLQETRTQMVREHNTRLRAALSQYPAVRFNSPENAVPHILNLSVNDVKGTVFQRELGRRGVCVSVKTACAEAGTPSRAVLAVSGSRRNALSAWRLSLSHLTTAEEIESFLRAFDSCYKELVR